MRRYIPTRDEISRIRWLRWLGPHLAHPRLWHFSRRGVAIGVGLGVFFGLLIPIAQIPFAAGTAVLLRANVPAAVGSTLVTNPVTFAPVYLFAHHLGATLLGQGETPLPDLSQPATDTPQAWWQALWQRLIALGQPLLLGLAVLAVAAGGASYLLIMLFWRLKTTWQWRRRRRLAIGPNGRMNMRQSILWQPRAAQRHLILAGCLGLTAVLTYLHYRTGLAYEFHVFFILPVLLAAWYLGLRAALALALLSIGLWFIADRALGGDQADPLPLLFNTAMRLAIFVGGAWLLATMRRVLDREARLAREDALTGLTNRRAFYEEGRRHLALARRQGSPATAVFIDLDHFKEVNDELGHKAGDALLMRVGDTLRQHLRASDLAGRLGGDEFALLLPGMAGQAALAYVADLRQRLLDAMREAGWPVTFSIGIASCARAPATLEALLAEADKLMYEVKGGGRDRILQREVGGDAA
ncbi:MAG: DUF2062 domain-containing protein [Pseudomonadota bacterium]